MPGAASPATVAAAAGDLGAGEVRSADQPRRGAQRGGHHHRQRAVSAAHQTAGQALSGRAEQQLAGEPGPAPITTVPGSRAATTPARPVPSHRPTSARISRAAGSPSCAACVTCSPRSSPASPPQAGPAGRVLATGLDDLARGPGQHAGRGVLLPAAPVAALAATPVRDELLVPELAGQAVPAPLQPAVGEDRTTDAGAEGEHDEVALAPARPEPVLGPGRGVGVVVDQHRPVEPPPEALLQRLVPPGQVVVRRRPSRAGRPRSLRRRPRPPPRPGDAPPRARSGRRPGR